jgi:hypothetical protein
MTNELEFNCSLTLEYHRDRVLLNGWDYSLQTNNCHYDRPPFSPFTLKRKICFSFFLKYEATIHSCLKINYLKSFKKINRKKKCLVKSHTPNLQERIELGFGTLSSVCFSFPLTTVWNRNLITLTPLFFLFCFHQLILVSTFCFQSSPPLFHPPLLRKWWPPNSNATTWGSNRQRGRAVLFSSLRISRLQMIRSYRFRQRDTIWKVLVWFFK